MAYRDYNSPERRCRYVFRATDSLTFPDSDYGTEPCFLRSGGYNTAHPGNARTPAQVQETPEPAPAPSPEPELEVTEGTETYRGIQMGNVLHARRGTFIITSMFRKPTTAANPMHFFLPCPVMRDCTSRAWGEAYIARTLLLRH